MEQAKESIKRQKKKVFRNFIALMAGSLTLLISIAKAENQASKVMAELEKLQKLSNKKYYTYSTEQINELFVAIQSVLDETKETFTTSNGWLMRQT